MKRILLFLLIIPFFWSCKETEPTPAEALVANKDWQTQGLFVNGVATEAAPYVKIRFSKSTINSTIINGQNLGPLATWSVVGNTLSLTYPNFSTTGAVSFASQSVKITKSSETELWVTPLDGVDGISLFGLINLSQGAEFRFTLNPNSVAPNVTDANLTGVTWKGFGDATAGYFANNIKQGDANNLTMKFGTFYGINYVSIAGVPTPATWALNATKTRLILSYPKLGITPGATVAFNITSLTATSFRLSAANTINILNGAINLPINQELRMIPQ